MVGYIEEDYRFLRMLEAGPREAQVYLTLKELNQMQREADVQPVPGHVHRAMARSAGSSARNRSSPPTGGTANPLRS